MRIEKADLEKLNFTLTVAEDLDCSGLPVCEETSAPMRASSADCFRSIPDASSTSRKSIAGVQETGFAGFDVKQAGKDDRNAQRREKYSIRSRKFLFDFEGQEPNAVHLPEDHPDNELSRRLDSSISLSMNTRHKAN